MGLILDSSVLISAERKGDNSRRVLTALVESLKTTDIAICVITLMELTHGVARAETRQRKQARMQFIQELTRTVPVHLVTEAIAIRAGEIDGHSQARGVRIPLADLLIGVTALELGYGVATSNPRHFRLISGLSVLEI